MAKPQRFSKKIIVEKILPIIWRNGFSSSSMQDFVNMTGLNRHAIYSLYSSKEELLIDCLTHYEEEVVSPALKYVEQESASLESIQAYFDYQIDRAENIGIPGPGCLMVNTQYEEVSQVSEVAKHLQNHKNRLLSAFIRALRNSNRSPGLKEQELKILAENLLIFSQGLWSTSRHTQDAQALRQNVQSFLSLLKERLSK